MQRSTYVHLFRTFVFERATISYAEKTENTFGVKIEWHQSAQNVRRKTLYLQSLFRIYGSQLKKLNYIELFHDVKRKS